MSGKYRGVQARVKELYPLAMYTHCFTTPPRFKVPADSDPVKHWNFRKADCHAGTKSARPSIAPLSEPQRGLPLTEPAPPYSLDYNRSRSDGRKLSTPTTSRTPAARRGEKSTNLLAGLDAPLACALSRQIPSPHNS